MVADYIRDGKIGPADKYFNSCEHDEKRLRFCYKDTPSCEKHPIVNWCDECFTQNGYGI